MDERSELVIKAAERVSALRIEKKKLTAEIDGKLKVAEAELAALIGSNGGSHFDPEGRQMTIQDRILSLLRADPQMKRSKMTVEIYGADTPKFRDRLRSTLYTMKKINLIEEDGEGFKIL